MKEKILFLLLFIVSSLSAMDEEQEKWQAEILWSSTHRVGLCEKVSKEEVLEMCPKEVHFEREKQLDKFSELVGEISTLKFVHKGDLKEISAYFKTYLTKCEELRRKLAGLKIKLKEETVNQFGAQGGVQEQLRVLDQLLIHATSTPKDRDFVEIEKKCRELKELGKKRYGEPKKR